MIKCFNMDNTEEIWKVFYKGEQTIFEISNLGGIKSFFRGKWHIKKSYIDKNSGYWRATFSMGESGEKKKVNFSLHRLVALLFVNNPNPEKFNIVNHKDGNKLNCNADNLEWCDHLWNQRHAWATGLRKKKYGKDAPRARKIGKYFAGILLKTYDSLIDTEKDGFKSDCICAAAKRKGTSKGFFWHYLD
jgi:hypothetical protein